MPVWPKTYFAFSEGFFLDTRVPGPSKSVLHGPHTVVLKLVAFHRAFLSGTQPYQVDALDTPLSEEPEPLITLRYACADSRDA